MVNHTELRIGNLIMANGRIMYALIVGYNDLCMLYYPNEEGDQETEQWQNIEGILLTPEILEKAGFNFEDMVDLGMHVYIIVSHPDLYLTYNEGTIWIGEYDTEVKCVHQLQNLYFALTGSELEINL